MYYIYCLKSHACKEGNVLDLLSEGNEMAPVDKASNGTWEIGILPNRQPNRVITYCIQYINSMHKICAASESVNLAHAISGHQSRKYQ